MARRDIDDWFWQVGADLNRLSDEMGVPGRTLVGHRYWEPRVDLYEHAEALIVKVELAGVRTEDVHLSYDREKNSVTVRGFRREQEGFDGSRTGCHQLEIFYGEFEREIALPHVPIAANAMRAKLQNGILCLLIPKVSQVTIETTITITTT
ncbi:MAG: Hsp20/alpha crystallin family protein [Fimbriimonadaceae bacterium]